MFDDMSAHPRDDTLSAGDPVELDTDALPSFPDPGVLLTAAGLPSRAIREVLRSPAAAGTIITRP